MSQVNNVHTWVDNGFFVDCPWCGQKRQGSPKYGYWVVTYGKNEPPPPNYDDILHQRPKPPNPDPELCAPRNIVQAPLMKFYAPGA